MKYFSLLPLIISSVSDPVAWKVEAGIVNARMKWSFEFYDTGDRGVDQRIAGVSSDAPG
jgi:hypothetical protein